MSARLLATIGAGLAARGETVTLACCRGSDAERELVRLFPGMPLRTVSGSLFPSRVARIRALTTALRPDVVLVHNERDGLAAALAVGRTAGVVRRLAIGERLETGWRTRVTLSRTRFVAMGDDTGPAVHGDKHVRTAVSWPGAPEPARDAGPFRTGSLAAPVIAIVAGNAANPAEHAAGAAALRAAARIVSRHPDLRVSLLGQASGLQALRVHAGALGLAERLVVVAVETLLAPGEFAAATVWVTAGGDEGAVAVVAAMMRRIPVIVPRGFDTAALVAPRITGFTADDTDLAGSVSALAHLMADTAEHHAMGAAAAARAERLHGWDAMLTRTMLAIARVAA